MPKPFISVIVPTYNRASLLERTIPTYLQDEVAELILVDDASTDGTREAAAILAAADDRIRYLKSERNLKQTHAKNMGIDAARCELLYFGDDDSVLLPGSIAWLAATMRETKADIVGASALYMIRDEEPVAIASRRKQLSGPFVDADSLRVHFDTVCDTPIEVPFVHAAFLCRAALARDIRFDEGYIGNCFREETDFLIRARAAGARIVYESHAVQVNLPRSLAGGGAHGSGRFFANKFRYLAASARNNRRFLRKNRSALAQSLGIDIPPIYRQARFLLEIVRVILSYPLRKVFALGR